MQRHEHKWVESGTQQQRLVEHYVSFATPTTQHHTANQGWAQVTMYLNALLGCQVPVLDLPIIN